MYEPRLTIGGKAVARSSTFDVLNPADGSVIGRAPASGEHEVDQAVTAAFEAWQSWRGDPELRATCLREAAAKIGEASEELTRILTAEQGKPLAEAAMEVRGLAGYLQYYAALAPQGEVLQDDDQARVEVVRQPLGPVAAITPWNFPLVLAAWKLGPALVAGNTVVWKPSPYTPLSALLVGELVRDVFPPGVINVLSGDDRLGALLVEHPLVRGIGVTGSVETGKAVARTGAPDLKRVILELGGNDPAIVLEDAAVDAIAPELFWAAFKNCGQVCTAVKRVYVPPSLHDDLVEALADQARSAVVGDGAVEGVQIGPLNNERQLRRVRELVEDAVDGGGVAAAGGQEPDGPGYFFEPTILHGVGDEARIVAEEQFGPVLPIVPYRDVDKLVERLNQAPYGLGSSVWGSDVERARRVAALVDAGTTWINAHSAARIDQPVAGRRWSGLGVENGPQAVHSYSEPKVLYERRA